MKQFRTLISVLCLFAMGLALRGQGLEIHSFTNVNHAVPDGNAAGLSDVQTFSSSIASLTAVRVKLRVAGEFNGDLYVYVRHISPGQTNFCVLLNRVGRSDSNAAGYADSGFDITLDDAASNGDIHVYRNIATPAAGTPLTGTWQPDGRNVDPAIVLTTNTRTTTLNSFTNVSGGGEWTLFLADLESGGTNMLVSWELQLNGIATPTVLWATPADIVYGTTLSGTQLNASSPVAGTFNYSPPVGTVLNAGSNQTLSVTFTPTDASSYTSVTTNVAINVLEASTTGIVNSSANPSLPGQLITFTMTLSAVPPGAGTPAGFVQFKVDGINAGSAVALSGGTASYSISTLALGTHTVTAEYPGDGNFLGTTNTLTSVQLVNTPPVAGADTIYRWPTNATKVSVADLLANDSDADGDPVTFVSVSATSANGGILLLSNSWIFYTPPTGFTNTDTFTYTISDGRGAPVIGTVTVAIQVDTTPSPDLVVTYLGAGAYEVRFDGIPGRTYHIQYSEDLKVWQPLGSGTGDASGLFGFVDTPPQGSPQRFYRAVYP